jgi:HEAT repeat protein
MKKIQAAVAILAIHSLLGIGAASFAQRNVPGDSPAEVRKHMESLSSEDPAQRAAAACALGRMGERAAAAIPALVALLSDGAPIPSQNGCGNQEPFEDEAWAPEYEQVKEPSPGEAATHALMAIGEQALEPLKAVLLRGDHWRARKNAAWALAHRGEAVEQLVAALKDTAWQVRSQAAYALFQRGGGGRQVIEALSAAMNDEAWQVREQAVFALGHKSRGEADVVKPLIAALKHEDARVRAGAAASLWHCADSTAFAPLMAALKDENPEVRENAAGTLGNRAGDREVQLLIDARNDPDSRVRKGVRRALEIIKHRMRGKITNLRRIQIPD